MKIKVKDLRPNPFRKIKTYPIDRDKIKALKISIGETTFWDNIVARKNNGKFEIAYGHHRLITLKELGIKEVDIPVRQFDDAMMIKIMANENLDDWSLRPAVINETVLVAKEFLNRELAKYETWEALGKFNRRLIDKFNFNKIKQQGVGHDTILKFLGGNWKEWIVKQALDTFALHKRGVVDRRTIETIPKMTQARVFKKSVQDYNIPKSEQKRLAKKIVTEDIGSRDIPKTVRDAAPKYEKTVQDPEVERLKNELEKIRTKANSLYVTILGFNQDMQKLKVKQVKGVQAFFTTDAIADLLPAVKKLLNLFGFNFKQLCLKAKSDES